MFLNFYTQKMTPTKVLYVSYDGMMDSLGQSQVIPYIEGLTKLGFEFHLLSCEKPERYGSAFNQICKKLQEAKIHWHPIPYTSSPPVLSTIKDIRRLNKESEKLNREHHFQAVHCRSYIAAFVGLKLKMNNRIPFIFDMRGFWADERIDGKIWNIKNPFYYLIYKYFKRKEKEFLNNSDHIISLTEIGKSEIIKNFGFTKKTGISVIPCCVDNELFSGDNISLADKNVWMEKLKINTGDFIVSYSGSVGTWYMLEEMLDFFIVLSENYPEAKFLFITLDDPEKIISESKSKNIGTSKIIICKAKRAEMPILLSLSTLSLFFIKPAYSKKASSPTKMGELMSMGIPFITNSGVGDIDKLVNEYKIGIVVKDQTEASYREAIGSIPALLEQDSEISKNVAKTKYSLEYGVTSYYKIYNQLIQKSQL
jgi:glycosyltransferase involved in cell wall biosynthesis